MSAKIVSVCNLKGGVGKSTTALSLVETLTAQRGLGYEIRVLLVDLDPQASLSQMLLANAGLKAAHDNDKGVYHLVAGFLASPDHEMSQNEFLNLVETSNAMRMREMRERLAENPNGARIHLLPSHEKVRYLEPELERSTARERAEVARKLAAYLKRAILSVQNNYDLIVIDTPPNVSALLRAGLRLTDVFINPTVADQLGEWALGQFSKWVRDEQNDILEADVREKYQKLQFIAVNRFERRSGEEALTAYRRIQQDHRPAVVGPTVRATVHAQRLFRRAPDAFAEYNEVYRDSKFREDLKAFASQFVIFMQDRGAPKWPNRAQ